MKFRETYEDFKWGLKNLPTKGLRTSLILLFGLIIVTTAVTMMFTGFFGKAGDEIYTSIFASDESDKSREDMAESLMRQVENLTTNGVLNAKLLIQARARAESLLAIATDAEQRGLALVVLGDCSRAMALFDEVLAQDTADTHLRAKISYQMGVCHHLKGNATSAIYAIEEYGHALEYDSTMVVARFSKAAAHTSRGEGRQAEECLAGVVTDDKRLQQSLEQLLALAKSLQEEDQRKNAIQRAEHSPSFAGIEDSVPNLKGLATTATEAGDFTNAIPILYRIVEANPRDSIAWKNLGEANFEVGLFHEAARCYGEAYSLNLKDYAVCLGLGLSLKKIDEPEESATSLRNALELRPQEDSVWALYAGELWASGHHQEAMDALDHAIFLSPNSASFFHMRCIWLYEQKDTVGALQNCRTAVDIDPNDFESNRSLGAIHANQLNLDSAEYYYKKALALDTCAYQVMTSLGFVHIDLREYDSAKSDFRQSMDCIPDSCDAWMIVGRRHLAGKHFDWVDTCVQRALSVDPTCESAQDLRKQARVSRVSAR